MNSKKPTKYEIGKEDFHEDDWKILLMKRLLSPLTDLLRFYILHF